MYLRDFVGLPGKLRCSFCHAVRERMTMWMHDSGVVIYLCFHGCQHFPEPFRDTGLSDNWDRVDPWQDYKRSQPGLRGHASQNPVSQSWGPLPYPTPTLPYYYSTTTGLDGNNKVTSYRGVTNRSPHARDGLTHFPLETEGGRR